MNFPRVTASNLSGRRFDLPADLDLPALVLIAFQRGHQPFVDTWLGLADDLAAHGIATYELPVIARLNSLARWGIDAGMRAGIPDRTARDRTITVYTDTAAFRRALDVPDDSRVVALLLDQEGRVRWRGFGARTEAAERSLRKAIPEATAA